MPITVSLPSRGTQVQFPDDASEKEINEVLERDFPRSGEDVKYDLQDRNYTPTYDDYKKYEDYVRSTDEDTAWTQLILDGAGHMLSTVGGALAGVATDPLRAPASVAEGAAQGTQQLYGMVAQSEDPDSIMFRLKDSLLGGTPEERYEQFVQARDFNTKLEKLVAGDETALIPKEFVNNKIVQGAALFLDPTLLIPIGGELVGAGKLATRLTGAGLRASGRVARAAAAPVTRTIDAAAAGIKSATGLTGRELSIGAGAAGAGALAHPVGQAIVGTAAGAEGLDIVGDTLMRVGKNMANEPQAVGPLAMVAADETARKSVRNFANVASRMYGDVALDVAPRAIAGAAEGAVVGGTLGGLTGGDEGAASGIGGGLALGAAGAGVTRLVQHTTGRVDVERGRADAARVISALPEAENLGMGIVLKADGKKKGREVVVSQRANAAKLASALGSAAKGGEGLFADFMSAAAANGDKVVLINDDTPHLPSWKTDGRKFRGARAADGTIVINVDAVARAAASDPSVLAHEFGHARIGKVRFAKELGQYILEGEKLNEIRSQLFGVEAPDGSVITRPIERRESLQKFADDYAKAVGTDAWNRYAKDAFDPAAPAQRRLEAQNRIADEYYAQYMGESVFKRSLFGRRTYTGRLNTKRINTVGQSVAAVARDLWMRKTERRIREGGLYQGNLRFADDSGSMTRSRTLERIIDDVIERKSLDEEHGRARINFKDSTDLQHVADAYGAHDIFVLDNNGKVVRPKTVDEESAAARARVERILAELEKLPPSERSAVREELDDAGNVIDRAADEGSTSKAPAADTRINIKGATTRELEVILKFLNGTQRENLKRVVDAVRSGDRRKILEAINFTAVRKGRSGKNQYVGVTPTAREIVPLNIFISKAKNIYFDFVDIGQVHKNIDSAMRVEEFKKLYKTHDDAWADFHRYIDHLAKGGKDTAAMFGSELKRQFFYEVTGTRPSKHVGPINRVRETFSRNERNNPFKSFRIDRVSKVAETGETLNFNDTAYTGSQLNLQPEVRRETIGNSEVSTRSDGFRILSRDGTHRVYAPDNRVVGVTKDAAEAARMADRAWEKSITDLSGSMVRFQNALDNNPHAPSKKAVRQVGGERMVDTLYEFPFTFKRDGKRIAKTVVINAFSPKEARAALLSEVAAKIATSLVKEKKGESKAELRARRKKFADEIVADGGKGLSVKTSKGFPKGQFPVVKLSGARVDDSAPKVVTGPKTREGFDKGFNSIDAALEASKDDPNLALDPDGFVRSMARSLNGASATIPPAPSRLWSWVLSPEKFKSFILGGHEKNPALIQSAVDGLNSLSAVHDIAARGGLHPKHVALNFYWGLLSRMLAPYNQEAGWIRGVNDPRVVRAIEDSVAGRYKMSEAEWEGLVQEFMGLHDDIPDGRGATSNSNDFHAMLSKWNGRWGELAEVLNNPSLTGREMRREFYRRGFGGAGIKHKVLSFVIATLARRDLFVGDRWQVVNLWFDHLETAAKHRAQAGGSPDIFALDKDGVPEDTTGAYDVIGDTLKNDVVADAVYRHIERGLDKVAADAAPWLTPILGRAPTAFDIHWLTWNIIKNEPVGHSSLEATTKYAKEGLYDSPEFATLFSNETKRTERYSNGGFVVFSARGSERPEIFRTDMGGGSGDNLSTAALRLVTRLEGHTESDTRVQFQPEAQDAAGLDAVGGVSGAGVAARGTRFHDHIAEAKRTHKYGAAVDVKPTEFYTDPNTRLFLADDGSAGVAVSPEGDLVSVFKKPASTADVDVLLADAARAAQTLDAYDIKGFLPTRYSEFGFKPVARVKFSPDFAPPDWNYEMLGTPDVVLMVKDPSVKPTDYKTLRDSVPLFEANDYDSAAALQQAEKARMEAQHGARYQPQRQMQPVRQQPSLPAMPPGVGRYVGAAAATGLNAAAKSAQMAELLRRYN